MAKSDALEKNAARLKYLQAALLQPREEIQNPGTAGQHEPYRDTSPKWDTCVEGN
jgi:hypothetical protein